MESDEKFEFIKIVIDNFILENLPIERTGILTIHDLPSWKDREDHIHVKFKMPKWQ